MLTNVVTGKNYQSIFGQNSDYVIGDMNEMTLKDVFKERNRYLRQYKN